MNDLFELVTTWRAAALKHEILQKAWEEHETQRNKLWSELKMAAGDRDAARVNVEREMERQTRATARQEK